MAHSVGLPKKITYTLKIELYGPASTAMQNEKTFCFNYYFNRQKEKTTKQKVSLDE